MTTTPRLMLTGLTLVALLVLTPEAFAQRDAGAKARGDYSGTFWSTRSANRSVRHARDYSQGAREYIQATPKASPQYLRADAAEVGRNVAAAKAEVTYLKAQAARDKELLSAVTSIEKHLTAAEKEHETFDAECAKDTIDSKATMACCSALSDHLTKAADELEALQKKLTPKPTAPNPKK